MGSDRRDRRLIAVTVALRRLAQPCGDAGGDHSTLAAITGDDVGFGPVAARVEVWRTHTLAARAVRVPRGL